MTRESLPFAVNDISALAKSLGEQIHEKGKIPGHLELLNMLARGAGFRNYQHFRAEAEKVPAPEMEVLPEREAPPAADPEKVLKVARHFDAEGRLVRWPSKASQQELCLWVMWSRIPAREIFDEKGVSELLALHHTFGDHALLRRELFTRKMVARTKDGRRYERIEQQPTPEAIALIRHLGAE